MVEDHDSTPTPQPETDKPGDPPLISAEQLFQGKREVWIEFEGERYRLRITRRNKLILQK